MKTTKPLVTLPFLAITSLLAACGGGSGSDDSASTPGGTATGVATDRVISSGVITGFGSVYVNGVRYDTRSTQIISADDNAVLISNPSNAQLRDYLGLGQVITLSGSASDDGSNGIATAIYVDNELVGPVTGPSISSANGTFTVLGQRVAVTPDTIIDDSIIERVLGNDAVSDDIRFADIAAATGQDLTLEQLLSDGMLLEINGFVSQQQLLATRIEDVNNRDRRSPTANASTSGEVELKGFVQNLAAGQFTLNGLTVFYDAADLDADDFAGRALQQGQYVEVKGTPLSAESIDAREIELEDDFRGSSGISSDANKLEIEGVISALRADASGSGGVAVISGQQIRLNDLSQFSVGMRVEIKGRLQDGVLVLNRVQEESEASVRIEDVAETISGSQIGTRLGLEVTTSERTQSNGQRAGNRVEARGFPLNGNVVWTRVELDDDRDDADCELRGPVQQITGSGAADFGFVIQGVTIDVSQIASDGHFQGSNNETLGRQAFYSRLAVGDVVEAESVGNGCSRGNLLAREVEFERSSAFVSGGFDRSDDDDDDRYSEIRGVVSSASLGGFVVNGTTIQVSANTLIDDSIIENMRGVEVDDEQRLGDLAESLPRLLPTGLAVEVSIVRSGSSLLATRIEDL